MKELSLEKMETLEASGFMDGACAVVAFADVGAGVAALVGSLALPGWGTAVLVGASAACLVYAIW
jgi:hypothetical protein